MGMKRRNAVFRRVRLLVRPAGEHAWWAKDELGTFRWAAIDPYDPPSWSLVVDSDSDFDNVELWAQLKITVEDHVAALKEEFLDEYGPDDDEAGCQWEFKLSDQTSTSDLSTKAT